MNEYRVNQEDQAPYGTQYARAKKAWDRVIDSFGESDNLELARFVIEAWALEPGPEQAIMELFLARVDILELRFESALQRLEAFKRGSGVPYIVNAERAMLLSYMGRHREAWEGWKSIQPPPHAVPDYQYQTACLCSVLGRPIEALQLLRKCLPQITWWKKVWDDPEIEVLLMGLARLPDHLFPVDLLADSFWERMIDLTRLQAAPTIALEPGQLLQIPPEQQAFFRPSIRNLHFELDPVKAQVDPDGAKAFVENWNLARIRKTEAVIEARQRALRLRN